MGEACWIKTEQGDPAANSALAWIGRLMGEHYLKRPQEGCGRMRDRKGMGQDLEVLGQTRVLWVCIDRGDTPQATVGTREQEVGVVKSPHCTHTGRPPRLATLSFEEGPPRPLITSI